jgi:hypothetical protein
MMNSRFVPWVHFIAVAVLGYAPGTQKKSIHVEHVSLVNEMMPSGWEQHACILLFQKRRNSSASSQYHVSNDASRCSPFARNCENKILHSYDKRCPRLRGGSSKKPRKSARRSSVAQSKGGTSHPSPAARHPTGTIPVVKSRATPPLRAFDFFTLRTLYPFPYHCTARSPYAIASASKNPAFIDTR